MVSSTTHALFSLIGWSIIPDLATSRLLRIINSFSSTYLGIPSPPPGTPQYARRYRYTFALVVLGYLTYTLIEGSQSIQPNFYEVLGVTPTVDEAGLKNAFKGFAKKYHPDRVGPQGEAIFIKVREMFEALKDPVVRFAYDRFGPDVLKWEQLSTEREYLRHGLIYSSGYHIFAFIGLQFWSAIGEPSPVAFWRYILYASLFTSEVALLLSPSPSTTSAIFSSTFQDPTASPTHRTLLHLIFPERVAFQHVLFLHHLFVFLSIALSRVAPQLFPGVPKIEKALTDKLNVLASVTDRETSIMLHTELHSIHPLPPNLDDRPSLSKMRPMTSLSPDVMEVLEKEMSNMIIEANVKKDTGPIARAWKDAIAKGRAALRYTRSANTVKSKEANEKISESWESLKGQGELPSPRPSPPPQRPGVQRRGSSFVRARSVTY